MTTTTFFKCKYSNFTDVAYVLSLPRIKDKWALFFKNEYKKVKNIEELASAFYRSVISQARDDFLLFCQLNYSIVGQMDLDVAFHVEVLTTICQLHSYDELILDKELTAKDKTGKRHYKRDGRKPYLPKGEFIISIPPGHGKTSICGVLYSAWLLGKRPKMRIKYATCSASGKKERIEQIHKVMCSNYYKEIFGEVLIKNCGKTQVATFCNGFAVGTTTNPVKVITGDDVDFLCVDDPNNSVVINSSQTQKVVTWYQQTAKPRVRDTQNKMETMIIQQRVASNDLSGFVLKESEHNGKHVNHFVLKAEVFEDEDFVIHTENKGDIVFHRKKGYLYLPEDKEMRANKLQTYKEAKLDEERWMTQYQQTPFVGSENLFKPSYFNYFSMESLPPIDYTFITTDFSSKDNQSSDYCCLCYWGCQVTNNEEGSLKKLFLLDVLYDKFPQEDDRFEILLNFFNKNINNRFLNDFGILTNIPFGCIYIEDVTINSKTIGDAVVAFGERTIVQLKRKAMTKVTRAKQAIWNICTNEKKHGCMVFLQRECELNDKLLAECLSFSRDKTSHDDFVDNLCDAIMYGAIFLENNFYY